MIGTRARHRANVVVEPAMLSRIGLTDHAVVRFATRAGLTTDDRAVVTPLVRQLLTVEGRIVRTRPRWSGLRDDADLYLQVGEWMLLIGCHDERRAGRYSIVTVITRSGDRTWRRAWRRGHVATPPPPGLCRRPWLHRLLRIGRDDA